MKITKYNQSTLLIDTNNTRILIDPSNINYDGSLLDEWTNIDVILVTHKHNDHCHMEAINHISQRDDSKIYTTKEVMDEHNITGCNVVKCGDVIDLGDNIKVEVTKATHGYLTGMRENNKEILENVGYIVDDGNTRLYTTSDTLNFYNDYKCDVLCMPFNGNGLTMGIVDGVDFIKAINPKLLLPIHMQHPKPIMNPNVDNLKEALDNEGINYKILDIKESIEFSN